MTLDLQEYLTARSAAEKKRKIAGEQIIKLMTLGFTQEEAEEKIVESFLR